MSTTPFTDPHDLAQLAERGIAPSEAARQLEVALDHHAGELLDANLRLPAELRSRFRRIDDVGRILAGTFVDRRRDVV